MFPRKLKSGDQFRPVTVRTINEIIDYLQKYRLFPGNGVSFRRYASGMIISATTGKSSTASSKEIYTGFLAVKFYPDESSFGLVCGFDPENEIAGYFRLNGCTKAMLKSARVKAETGYLCICGELGQAQGSLVILSSMPDLPAADSQDNKKDHYPIALVTKQENGMFNFIQLSRWEIPQLWVFGRCDEETEEN